MARKPLDMQPVMRIGPPACSPSSACASAPPARVHHVDVAALVVRGGRSRGVHEPRGLVERDRRRELAVALEKELAGSAREVLRDDGIDEPAADAEPLVTTRDGHLRELETAIARVQESAGADDRSMMTRQEDGAARAQDLHGPRE